MICFTINIRIAELEVKCLPGRRSPSDEFPFNLLWTSFRMMEDSPWERKHFELPWILSCKNIRVQRGLGGYTVKICENVDAPLRPPFTTTKHCDGGVATAWFASSFVSRALKCVKEILKTFKGRYFQPWAGWPHGTIWNGWQSRMWLGRWGLKCGRQGRLSRFCNFTSGKLGKIHEQICSRRVKLKLRAVCRCCQDLRYTILLTLDSTALEWWYGTPIGNQLQWSQGESCDFAESNQSQEKGQVLMIHFLVCSEYAPSRMLHFDVVHVKALCKSLQVLLQAFCTFFTCLWCLWL